LDRFRPPIICLCRNTALHSSHSITYFIQYNHEHTVTGSSVRFLLQSYKYIGSDGLQITATTRLPQNAPNRIWNSTNFSAGDTPRPPSQIGKVQRWQPYCSRDWRASPQPRCGDIACTVRRVIELPVVAVRHPVGAALMPRWTG